MIDLSSFNFPAPHGTLESIFASMTSEQRKRLLRLFRLLIGQAVKKMTPEQRQIAVAKMMGVMVHNAPSSN